jgi:hypothetical protein
LIYAVRTWPICQGCQRVAGARLRLPVRGNKGKEADWLVTRIDPGVVLLVAELRAVTGAISLGKAFGASFR